MPERGVTPGSLLIDRFLPRYDLSVVHASVLPARPEDCYRAARQLDLFRDPIIRTLLGLRSLPNRLADRLGERQRTAPTVTEPPRTFTLDDMVRYGWVLLDEQPTVDLDRPPLEGEVWSRTVAEVFISYSRRDGLFVRELYGFLSTAGRDVWVDWEDIPPASQWEQDIDDSIDAAESVVFVVSAASLTSEECGKELRRAQEGGKRVVPIAIDGADPGVAPTALRQLNWIWARDEDDRVRGARARARHRPRVVARAHAAARAGG